jgi:hypothetical protein
MLALPIAAAIVPALLLLAYFHSRDIYPEPPQVVWATFFLGVLTIPAILLFALPMEHALAPIGDPYRYGLADAFLCAALPEEFFKFLVLSRYAARHKEFNEPMDGIVYGVAASLGFATLENILYVGSGGMWVAVLRALTAVPGHAFTGVVMGYFVGRARFAKTGREQLYTLGLLVPMLLHGAYDFPLLVIARFKKGLHTDDIPAAAGLLALLTLVTLIVEWRLAMRLVRRLRAEQEAGAGAPPVSQPAPVPQKPAAAPLLSWLAVLSGGLLATGGGLVVLVLGIGVATEKSIDKSHADLGALLLGGLIIGGLPLLLGLLLFRAGIRRMNQAGKAPPDTAFAA